MAGSFGETVPGVYILPCQRPGSGVTSLIILPVVASQQSAWSGRPMPPFTVFIPANCYPISFAAVGRRRIVGLVWQGCFSSAGSGFPAG